jgi:hypothetical protein
MTMRRSASTQKQRQTRSRRQGGTVVVPASGTALLLIDVINDLAFEGSEALVEQAESMATRLAALKRRATAAGVPAIYINDNFGQWRSDFRQTVAHCTKRTSPAAGCHSGCVRRRATTSCSSRSTLASSTPPWTPC